MLAQKNRSLLSYSYSKKVIGISGVKYEYDHRYSESAIREVALCSHSHCRFLEKLGDRTFVRMPHFIGASLNGCGFVRTLFLAGRNCGRARCTYL